MDFMESRIDYVELNGLKTRYVSAGEGEPVVLVHGTGGHIENFSKMYKELQKNYKVYAFDLWGFGLSAKPETDYTIPFWGNQLKMFIETVIGKPASVIGQSLGGWIAAYVAMNHSSWVRKLILLTSVGLELNLDEQDGIRKFQEFNRKSANDQEITHDAVRRRYSLNVQDASSIPEEWVDVRYTFYSMPETRTVMYHWTDYITGILDQNHAAQEYLLNKENVRKLQMPVLFLWAEYDSLTPVVAVERLLPYCPNASIYVVKDAGHWPHVEKPEEVNKIVVNFLLAIPS
jgi:2-hydroxy-6-oxonona-2,4-dienedioate hydrolase